VVEEQTVPAVEGSPTERASAALARHAWREAFEILSEADSRGELPPDALELLAQAAWWTGQLPLAIDARERAYGAALKAGATSSAAMAAGGLARDNILRNNVPIARAWINRAEELLKGVPENLAHGYLASCRSFADSVSGNNERSLEQASRALEIGTRLGDRNLIAFAKSEKGFALVAAGQVDEGLALIDDATISAVGGELEPSTAGGVCCTTIEACSALGEWARAAAWTEAQDRWCQREGINGFPGMCRLFRSEIKQLRGSWLEAEAEARQASVELEGFMPAAAGKALYRIGELRLLRGDLPAAEDALVRAHALGTEPEPLLSLLRLAQGRTDLAASGIRQALDNPSPMPSWRAPPGSALHRLPLLRAQVEIALAAGDLPTARSAADELASIADRFRSAFATASADTALGAVELAEGRAQEAGQRLRRAVQAWQELAAPYEAARARSLLADAYLVADDGPERAMLELHAARPSFAQLGATLDARRVEERLAGLETAGAEPAAARGTRIVRTFGFTDIVDSTRLAELLGDEAWGKLVHWHDQIIRAVVAEHGGEEIKATGDGFFLAFAEPSHAIEAMVAVQRRLSDHRDRHGFAPAVRIGLHIAEASQAGLDYMGMGVNYAARIGAAAQGGEILVSAATIAAATSRRTFAQVGERTLQLKGITAPVPVISVDWR